MAPYTVRPGVVVLLLALAGCLPSRVVPPGQEPPPWDLQPTRLEYVESDAFDALFESALVNDDPAIIIQTESTRPDWGPRLNAWIAAWNMGGKAGEGRKVRLQAAFTSPVVVNGESIREFRLLVEGLMGRVEDSVREQSAWFADRRLRERRVSLLRPYNLRFHRNRDGTIFLIFFHGKYAASYRDFIEGLGEAEEDGSGEWSRGFSCSACVHVAANQ